ncbi:unnamed protein product [Brassica rapa]|uniref:Apple domain-containing protein n=2 Tax=Brassica campestris TaxID=3711 RepID=A0A8D9LTM7_BRACM|nr:unnamed protein product [Brassica rapa]
MARGGGEWTVTGGGVVSYKRITLLVCSFNILIALFVLRFLYASSLHFYPNHHNAVRYTSDEIRKMEESTRIRRSKHPSELVRLVKKLRHEVATSESSVELSPSVKGKLVDEILERLKRLEEKSNVTLVREAVETWRSEKLKEAKELIQEQNGVNSTLIVEEAGMLVRALELEWDALSEEIGFWLPAEVHNEEHDDKPEGEEEPGTISQSLILHKCNLFITHEFLEFTEEILAGRPVPAVCNVELHTDYGGAAVRWGLTHHKESAADCCQACLDQAKRAKPGEMRCNIWVYCPSEFGCFSPDIYEHKHQECWLKYAEKPRRSFKDRYSEAYRNNHPKAPTIVPWVSVLKVEVPDQDANIFGQLKEKLVESGKDEEQDDDDDDGFSELETIATTGCMRQRDTTEHMVKLPPMEDLKLPEAVSPPPPPPPEEPNDSGDVGITEPELQQPQADEANEQQSESNEDSTENEKIYMDDTFLPSGLSSSQAEEAQDYVSEIVLPRVKIKNGAVGAPRVPSRSLSSLRSLGSPRALLSPRFGASSSPLSNGTPNSYRHSIDTASPFESVKEAVSKFGGITDWKAHRMEVLERRKFVEQELEKLEEQIPEYKKKSETVEMSKFLAVEELENTKRLIEELKLNLDKAETEEKQAKQDSDLAKMRVEEMEQGIAGEASVATKAQLEVAQARHTSAISELESVKEELQALENEYDALVKEKEEAVKEAEEAVKASKEVERKVDELTIELIASKESLECAHSSHLEAEEHKIGAVVSRDQETHRWEKELKQAEEELQKLKHHIVSTKELKAKLDFASALLLDLKKELEDYNESSKEKSHADVQTAVASAKKELEEVNANIEKASSEVKCLKVASSSLRMELEKERSALDSIKKREGMASIAVESLDAEIDITRVEIALVESKAKEAREETVELPKQLHQAAQEADEAKSLAELAREELKKSREEAEKAKAGARTVESRLVAAQKEIEASKASERLALATIKALQESESALKENNVDSPRSVTLTLDEYYELSKRAHEAEEAANAKVAAAVCEIEEAKETEKRNLEKLEEVNKEMDSRKKALAEAIEKAEKAKEGKLSVEQELRKWREEHDVKRKNDDDEVNTEKSHGEESKEKETESTGTETNTTPQAVPGKKKKKLFPRFLMFMMKKKSNK